MAWFTNSYRCDACDHAWDDEWSCMVDDECPICGTDTSPDDYTDLTVRVELCRYACAPAYRTRYSPNDASDRPGYVEGPIFREKAFADAWAAQKCESLRREREALFRGQSAEDIRQITAEFLAECAAARAAAL